MKSFRAKHVTSDRAGGVYTHGRVINAINVREYEKKLQIVQNMLKDDEKAIMVINRYLEVEK